ncbi:hypothetical protein CMI48_02770 [Candidatus Pacearchaeota archaeon]|jgi:hypothetical protein|nr:hypothetical protein [Candidatus Pacearchaeota archaeon]|tara:strand:+ start:179 stop:511 length:333 start_codon:yes stop_codon:yes gene_type:complete
MCLEESVINVWVFALFMDMNGCGVLLGRGTHRQEDLDARWGRTYERLRSKGVEDPEKALEIPRALGFAPEGVDVFSREEVCAAEQSLIDATENIFLAFDEYRRYGPILKG